MRTLIKLTWVEIKLFIREPITVVFTLVLPLIFLFVMSGVFGNEPENREVFRGVNPTDYYVPAYIGLVIASIGVVALPVHLTAYRERGVLRRFRASSMSVWTVFGSQVVVSFAITMLGAILLVATAIPAYDAAFPKSPGLVVVAFVLSVLSFSALGILLGAILPTTRAAQGLGLILFFVMMILSGAGPPRDVMTPAMHWISDATPLRYVILILQDPWLGFGWNVEASLVVFGIMVVAVLLSARFFRWE